MSERSVHVGHRSPRGRRWAIPKPRRRLWLQGLVWPLLVLSSPWTTATPTQAQRPVVVTSLVLEAPGLALQGEQRQALQQAAADELATLGERHFRFVDWRALHQLPDASDTPLLQDKANELRLHLVAETQQFGEDLNLVYRGRSPEDGELQLALPAETLVSWFEIRPEQDALRGALESRIREHLRAHFAGDDFLAKLEAQFLRRVTLTRSLQAQADLQAIVIPLAFHELAAAPGSKLGVTFSARNQDAELQDGRIELEPVGRAEGGRLAQCVIELFRFPPILVPQTGSATGTASGGSNWDERIPALLNSESLRNVRVYMARYVLETAELAEDP